MRRLYLQIYLAFLGIAAAVVLLVLAAGQLLLLLHPIASPRMRAAAELLAEQLPDEPAGQAALLARLGARMRVTLELRDAGGRRLVGSAATELPGPQLEGPAMQWLHGTEGPTVVIRLADGRWLAAAFADDEQRAYLLHLAMIVTLIVALIAVLCLPLARKITRRIEDLRRGVEGLGAGALGTRVQVVGRDEVAELATQFNRAAIRIEALVAGQQRMLASASHELRSPLARLRLAIELLAEAAPQQRALANEAGRDVEELDALVGDLLLASRLEARPPVREPIDLAALLAEEVQRAGARDMSSGPAAYEGDPAALRRLVRNLLENAARHGRPPVEAGVEAMANGWRIVVEDRGPGVAESERERIFAAFYRPAGHREGDGGVGLGLSLVRQIAQRHGGSARCEPRPGGGSRFVVELPRDAEGRGMS
jgi:signal transduction histidine kinase